MFYGTIENNRGLYRSKDLSSNWRHIASLSYNVAATIFIVALLVLLYSREQSPINSFHSRPVSPPSNFPRSIQPSSLVSKPISDTTSEKDISSDLGFENKVVLITGGCTGIGYYTSLAYARLGAKVVFCCRNVTRGKLAENNLNADDDVKKSGGLTAYYMADVQSQQQVRSLIFYATQTFGTLDILVNNAGILGWIGSADTIPDEHPRSVNDPMQTNFYGTFFCTQEAIAFWLHEGRALGIIVNIASAEGLNGFPGSSFYAASKHAVVGLTKTIAGEFASGNSKKLRVRVNAVAPGRVSTPMTWNTAKYTYYHQQPWEGTRIDSVDAELYQNFVKDFLKGLYAGQRIAEAWEIAPTILFLSSHYADYISGSVFPVDNTLTSTAVKLWQ